MNLVVSQLISGQVLYSGFALMGGLIGFRERASNRRLRHLLLVLIWSIGIVSLSTAAVDGVVIGCWFAAMRVWSLQGRMFVTPAPLWARVAVPFAASLLVISIDLPWTMKPSLSQCPVRAVVVLGDSISAGLGEGEGTPWPFQLRDAHHVTVYNLSEAGATTEDALRQIGTTDHFPGVVVVELGGNDLLGGRACAEFESDLEGILAYLHNHQRTVLMLEMPLLPGKNSWGVTQRRLARKYDCHLIPKRHFVEVLAAPGATVDTLHLTQSGHRMLAEMIWKILGVALPPLGGQSVSPLTVPHSRTFSHKVCTRRPSPRNRRGEEIFRSLPVFAIRVEDTLEAGFLC